MAQLNYETVGGDTLPSVAEACGHPGEWQAILDVNPWIGEGADYMNVPPGSHVLLPGDWVPAGVEVPTDPPAARSTSTRTTTTATT